MSEHKKKTAWMIRRDGTAFPCDWHVYGSDDDVEETLCAAEWLYEHTLSEKTKADILSLINTYARRLDKRKNSIRALLLDIKKKPYTFLSYNFVMEHAEEIQSAPVLQTDFLCENVNRDLNEEFLRARYGGMYDTKDDCRDMYFRVSSNGMYWWYIIVRFVESHKDMIDTVTIIRDEESTGECWYYTDKNGEEFDKYPISAFLDTELSFGGDESVPSDEI